LGRFRGEGVAQSMPEYFQAPARQLTSSAGRIVENVIRSANRRSRQGR